MSEARYLVKVPGGGQGGPYTAEQIQTFVASNQIPPGAQIIDIMASAPVAPPPGAPPAPAPVHTPPAAPPAAAPVPAPTFDPSLEAGFADAGPAMPAAPAAAPQPQSPAPPQSAMEDDFLDLIEVAPAPVPLGHQAAPAPEPGPSKPRPATAGHQRRSNTTRIKSGKRSSQRGRGSRGKTASHDHMERPEPPSSRRSKHARVKDEEDATSMMPIVLVVLAIIAGTAIAAGAYFYSQSSDDDLSFHALTGQWHIDTDRLEDQRWFIQTTEREQERLRNEFALETFTFSAPDAVMAHMASEPRWQRAETSVSRLRAQSLQLTITPYDNDSAGNPVRWQISRGEQGLTLDRDGRIVPLAQGPSSAFATPTAPGPDTTGDTADDDDAVQPDDQDQTDTPAVISPQDQDAAGATEQPGPSRPGQTTIDPQADVAAEAFETLKGPWRLDDERFFTTNYYINTNNALQQEDDGRQAARRWRSRLFATTYVFSEQHLDEMIGTQRRARERAIGGVRRPGTDLPAWQVDVEDDQGRRRSIVLMITGDNTMTLQVRAGQGIELTLTRGEAPQEQVDTYLDMDE